MRLLLLGHTCCKLTFCVCVAGCRPWHAGAPQASNNMQKSQSANMRARRLDAAVAGCWNASGKKEACQRNTIAKDCVSEIAEKCWVALCHHSACARDQGRLQPMPALQLVWLEDVCACMRKSYVEQGQQHTSKGRTWQLSLRCLQRF